MALIVWRLFSICPCLFIFSCVCFCFGSNGKQTRGCFPEIVFILGVLVNESGSACLCLFTYWVVLGTNAGKLQELSHYYWNVFQHSVTLVVFRINHCNSAILCKIDYFILTNFCKIDNFILMILCKIDIFDIKMRFDFPAFVYFCPRMLLKSACRATKSGNVARATI